MRNILLAAVGIFAGLPSIQAAPAAEPQYKPPSSSSGDGLGRSCDSFGYMSLGQLEVHNNFGDTIQIMADYNTDPKAALYNLGVNNERVRISPGDWHEFDRDSNLRWVDRDRDFYLFACMVPYGFGCERINGKFRIPKAGNKQWVARVDLNNKPCGGTLVCAGLGNAMEGKCTVDRAMRNAWAP